MKENEVSEDRAGHILRSFQSEYRFSLQSTKNHNELGIRCIVESYSTIRNLNLGIDR